MLERLLDIFSHCLLHCSATCGQDFLCQKNWEDSSVLLLLPRMADSVVAIENVKYQPWWVWFFNLILEGTCKEKSLLHLVILYSIRWQKIKYFINANYLKHEFSKGYTSSFQVKLVPLAAGDSHPIKRHWHLYSLFSQDLGRNIMDVVSSPDVLCDNSTPQLKRRPLRPKQDNLKECQQKY